MKKLKPYQLDCARSLLDIVRSGEDPLLIAPTGSGKTIIWAKVVKELGRSGSQILVIVPRKALVKQAIEELDLWGLDCGAIAGNMRESRRAQIQVATYQSLDRAIDWLKPDCTVLDEVHLSAFPAVVRRFLPILGEFRKSRAIGVTATPRRGDRNTSLGQYFKPKNLVFAPSIAQLIEMGFLVRPTYGICPNALSGRTLYDPQYVLDVYQQAEPRPTIAFAPSVAKAKATLAVFRDAGIEAAIVTGSTNNREEIFRRFREEELPVIINCMVLREGVDLPVATNLIMGIDPDSHSSYVQAIGRVLRPATYKDGTKKTYACIYDLTGCVDRHDRVEHLKYTAADLEIPDLIGEEVPVKHCPECDRPNRIAARMCPYCGADFAIVPQRTIVPEGDIFTLLSPIERIQKAFYEDALLRAYHLGDRPRTARDEFYQRFNYYPPLSWRRNFAPNQQICEWLLSEGAIELPTGDRQLGLELDIA